MNIETITEQQAREIESGPETALLVAEAVGLKGGVLHDGTLLFLPSDLAAWRARGGEIEIKGGVIATVEWRPDKDANVAIEALKNVGHDLNVHFAWSVEDGLRVAAELKEGDEVFAPTLQLVACRVILTQYSRRNSRGSNDPAYLINRSRGPGVVCKCGEPDK